MNIVVELFIDPKFIETLCEQEQNMKRKSFDEFLAGMLQC